MNVFKIASLNHVRALQRLVALYKGEASIDLASFVLQVRARNRYYSFYPQFLAMEGRQRYTLQPEEGVVGFVGWLPYFNKRWPIGTGKFPFKEYCQANGLRTPAMWRRPADDLRDFVVKRNAGSFGQGMRGPFKVYEPQNPAHALGEDGYFEAFIRGRILKAFFWDGRLACVEMLEMPTVDGDGNTTLRDLIRRKLGPRTPDSEWTVLAEIAAYDGMTMDAVPSKGQPVLVDFRYGSSVHPISYQNPNTLQRLQGSPIEKQLVDCGRIFWQGIPEELRDATLFSVDAVADGEDRVWLLEMNCNPVCQPDVYPLMFERLFGPAEAEAAAAQAETPPPPRPSALPPLAVPTRPSFSAPLAAGVRPWRLS